MRPPGSATYAYATIEPSVSQKGHRSPLLLSICCDYVAEREIAFSNKTVVVCFP